MASFGAHGPSAGAAAGAGARFGDAEGYVVPLLDVATPVEVRWLARPAGITKAACDGAASGVHEYLSRIGDGIDSGDATAVGGASRHRHDMDDKRAERLAQALRVSPGGFNSYSVVAILAHPHDPRCRILPRGWDSFALQATAASGEIFLLMGAKPAGWEVRYDTAYTRARVTTSSAYTLSSMQQQPWQRWRSKKR